MYLIQSARVVIHVLYVSLLTLTRCQIVATTYFFQRLVRQSERIRMTNHVIMMHSVLTAYLSSFPIYSSAIGASVLTHAVTCMPAKPSLIFRREGSELPYLGMMKLRGPR